MKRRPPERTEREPETRVRGEERKEVEGEVGGLASAPPGGPRSPMPALQPTSNLTPALGSLGPVARL